MALSTVVAGGGSSFMIANIRAGTVSPLKGFLPVLHVEDGDGIGGVPMTLPVF